MPMPEAAAPEAGALEPGLAPQRLIAVLADLGGNRQSRIAPSCDHDLARGIPGATKTTTHVGEVGVACRLEQFACALRASTGKAADHQLLTRRKGLGHHVHEFAVELHLARPFDENHRHVDRAFGMALRELGFRAHVEIDRFRIALEYLVSLRWLDLANRHRRMKPPFAVWLKSRAGFLELGAGLTGVSRHAEQPFVHLTPILTPLCANQALRESASAPINLYGRSRIPPRTSPPAPARSSTAAYAERIAPAPRG